MERIKVTIMTDFDAKYCAAYTAPADRLESDPDFWKHIKWQLIYRYMTDLFPEMIDDGKYHVMKFDFYKSEIDYMYRTVEYRLICRHSIAQTQHLVISEIQEREITAWKNAGYREACRWCGNALIISSRGACSACGGPAGCGE